jgi:hypothetical protein
MIGITMKILFSFLILFTTAFADERPLPKVKHMIDTHIHLYDPTREDGIPWPPKGDEVLYKPHLPAEFKRVSKSAGLTGVIIVEASDRLEDNRWVLDLVKGDDYFVALVGNIDSYAEDFTEQLTALRKDSRFVGIRARNGKEKKAIDYSDPKFLTSMRELAKNDLSVDILANGGGIEAVKQIAQLARAIPNLRIVVTSSATISTVRSPSPSGLQPSRSSPKTRTFGVKFLGFTSAAFRSLRLIPSTTTAVCWMSSGRTLDRSGLFSAAIGRAPKTTATIPAL